MAELHRYRVTMVRADRAHLAGEVKVDGTVVPGSVVLTDGWGGYKRPVRAWLRPQGDLAPDLAHVVMPSVHRVASLLTGWIFGTRRGSVDPFHLQAYLEVLSPVQPTHLTERGHVFRWLLEQAVFTGPVTEAEVTRRYPWPGPHRMPG